ncbi:hypothetical protein QIS99_19185 [Streptomyces sp. B-S-A8]|uniref:WXG100 family type VII secretion target n=1 Tax=Streptomyces solicavernae TaxID=3043614 RepID=A0ABT6RV39_9ACTN|nr:hypothetical protein [Streptomyces sp. B-S-A8]MDI3388311.1 hypothetical protein [Streptomyces sp. B-S-A8]
MSGEKEQKPVLESATCEAGRPETTTQFINYSLKELKQMLEGTDHKRIEETSQNWGHVHRILAGGEDNIADRLDKAVSNVLEHWTGEAANSFAKKAREISQSIRNAAWYADLNKGQFGEAAEYLKLYKPQLDAIKEPDLLDKAGDALTDWSWDNGESTAHDLNNKNMTAAQVAEANEGKIGASRETQLQAVAVMENLGAQYARVARNLNGNKIQQDDNRNIKDPDGTIEYPPPVTGGGGGASVPGAGGTTKPWSAGPPKGIGAAPAVPRDKGITGGSTVPSVKTNTDSLAPGLTGKTSLPGGGGGLPAGGGGVPGGGGPGGAFVPTGGGGPAGGGRGGLGAGGARGAGGAGTGRGAAGRAGMGGMGGGMGAGGRGAAGAGGRGALAKARGGVVGAAKGITGKGSGGGAGLHGSRGGSQRAGMGGGMAGGMGGRGGRRGEENEGRDRPDYLVEDEETWVSEEDRKRNVPKNIE